MGQSDRAPVTGTPSIFIKIQRFIRAPGIVSVGAGERQRRSEQSRSVKFALTASHHLLLAAGCQVGCNEGRRLGIGLRACEVAGQPVERLAGKIEPEGRAI